MNTQNIQNIQLPAIQIGIFGLKDQSHIIRHQAKLQRCPLDAGVDLIPSSVAKVIEYPGWNEVVISTMVHMVFALGAYGRITDRSSTASVTCGATVIPGVIDAGYTGEIMVRLKVIMPRPYDNFMESPHPSAQAIANCIKEQTPIAQILPATAFAAVFKVINADSLPKQGRGPNGFGSTNNIK